MAVMAVMEGVLWALPGQQALSGGRDMSD